MTPERQAAIDALAPFAAMADALDGDMPRYLKRPGTALIAYGAVSITNTHIRDARDAWRALTKETK